MAIDFIARGMAAGKADLVNGKVPLTQLPDNTSAENTSYDPTITTHASGSVGETLASHTASITSHSSQIEELTGNFADEYNPVLPSYSAYDSTATYAVGDRCIYSGSAYVCKTAITTAEAWTAAHWTVIPIYAVGDLVTHDNGLYKCVTAVTTVETWTAAHWTFISVSSEVSVLKEDLINYKNANELITQYANNDNWISGEYYDASGTSHSSAGFNRLPMLYLENGTYYITADNDNKNWNRSFSGLKDLSGTVTLLKDLPNYTRSGSFSFTLSTPSNLFLTNTTGLYVYVCDKEYFEKDYGAYKYTPWFNKICACLGTSLTANGGWTDVLKERFGFKKMYNRGSGGTTLANYTDLAQSTYVSKINIYDNSALWLEPYNTCYYDSSNIYPGYESYTHISQVSGCYSGQSRVNTLPTNADLVIVDIGTNDYFRIYDILDWDTYLNTPQINTPYRQSTNPPTYDITKMGDAFLTMVQNIKTRCPNAKIVVWGMLYNANLMNYNAATGESSDALDKWYAMNSYIDKLCHWLGIPFIDMLHETGINVFNLTDYCEDGMHPYKSTYSTKKGLYAVANVLTKHLQEMYPKDYLTD